jgi:hypothetical protein
VKVGLKVMADRVSGPGTAIIAKVNSLSRRLWRTSPADGARLTWQRNRIQTKRTFHTVPPEMFDQVMPETALRVNCISDLLLYKPEQKSDLTKQQFLYEALRQFEAGARCYTLVENEVLLHCSWLRYLAGTLQGAVLEQDFPPNACFLWGSYTHSSAKGRRLQEISIRQRAKDAAAIPGVEVILLEADKSPYMKIW